MKKGTKEPAATPVMLQVGGSATEQTLPALTTAILRILECGAGDEVKKAAIGALRDSFKVESVSINNCNFDNH